MRHGEPPDLCVRREGVLPRTIKEKVSHCTRATGRTGASLNRSGGNLRPHRAYLGLPRVAQGNFYAETSCAIGRRRDPWHPYRVAEQANKLDFLVVFNDLAFNHGQWMSYGWAKAAWIGQRPHPCSAASALQRGICRLVCQTDERCQKCLLRLKRGRRANLRWIDQRSRELKNHPATSCNPYLVSSRGRANLCTAL